ncbi:HAD hydrolase family protein [Actinoplanes campanulatus]|uniref:HAD hydrolase family protein n=1 Tax=Actinoplanes campanulatus TaxID=113559 RepID=UPI003557936F
MGYNVRESGPGIPGSACRVVVTDLDGTVVPHGDTISSATLAAAAALRDRDVPLVAVTARTTRATPPPSGTPH